MRLFLIFLCLLPGHVEGCARHGTLPRSKPPLPSCTAHFAEDGGESACRHRLILTHRVAGLARDQRNARALLWNQAGASFEDARRALGAPDGVLAVIGGANVFGLFLEIGYDSFHLSRANTLHQSTQVLK